MSSSIWDRLTFRVLDALGYFFCELAFKTGCRGPFGLSYRLGCWLYGTSDEIGIRCGELVPNPAYPAPNQPMYLYRRALNSNPPHPEEAR